MDWNVIAELVERVQMGEENAFTELYELTLPYVCKSAERRLRNKSDIDDVVQEVYIEVYRSISKLQNSRAFGGWLKKIVHQKSARHSERTKKTDDKSVYIDDEELHIEISDKDEQIPEEVFMTEETRSSLRALIDGLPQVQQDTLRYFYFDELKIRQIAVLMDCSENTVKSRLDQSKKKLEKQIDKKRKQGIAFPVVLPLPLLIRLCFKEQNASHLPKIVADALARQSVVQTSGIKATAGILSAAALVFVAATIIVIANGGRSDEEVPVIEYEHEYTREEIVDVTVQTTADETRVETETSAETEAETSGGVIGETNTEAPATDNAMTVAPVTPQTSQTSQTSQSTEETQSSIQTITLWGKEYTQNDYMFSAANLGLTDLSELDGLSNADLPRINTINCTLNQIVQITQIANFPELTDVYANYNLIEDISPLKNLLKLEKLDIMGNQISDLSPLTNLTKLKRLDVDKNKIEDLSPLAGLTNLSLLALSDNKISDISHLSELKNLTSLSLRDNQVSDISPLMGLKNLAELNLIGNPISEEDVEALRKALPNTQINFW